MNNSSQPSPPYKTIALVLAGALVGIAITVAVQNSSKDSGNANKMQVAESAQVQEQATSAATASVSQPAPQAAAPQSLPPMPSQTSAGTWQQAPAAAAAAAQPSYVPEGRNIEYANTVSGYTIYTGRRAVDSEEAPTYSSGAAATDETGSVVAPASQPIGRNGLRGNPCVDPASTFGSAYGRRPY